MVGLSLQNKLKETVLAPRQAPRIMFLALAALLMFTLPNVGAAGYPPPLLLSFDVEDEGDIAALNQLNLREPASYFITGQFAQKHPEFVKKLAAQGTIGSHSYAHPHSTRIKPAAVRADLAASQKAIKAATGRSPVWFRAPYLEYDETVLKIARELGFRFDSSESERWLHQKILAEFPISLNSTAKVLFSDYDIFTTYGMDAELALDLLKENYRARSTTGRPFVFLLHPRIIAEHAQTLHQFIRYVKAQGGQCLTFDQYQQKNLAHRPRQKGVRIDLRRGVPDPEQYAQALVQAGITDAFLMATDRRGQKYYPQAKAAAKTGETAFVQWQRRLKKAGVRVHAWISVNRNTRRAQQFPKQAMTSADGKNSAQWLSPSHPATHRHLQLIIRELVAGSDLDGIHLDHIEYPSLDYDFSDAAVQAFHKETGFAVVPKNPADQLQGRQHNAWIAWRLQQIARLVKGAAETLRLQNRKNIVLSAALRSRAANDFKVMETTGQDYRLLAESLDMLIPFEDEPRASQDKPPLKTFISTTRFLIGEKVLLIGIPISGDLDITQSQGKDFMPTVASSYYGTQGIVFSPAPNFDRTGQHANPLSAGLPQLLKQTEEIWREAAQRPASYSIAPSEALSLTTRSDRAPGARMWLKRGAMVVAVIGLVTVAALISRRYRKARSVAKVANIRDRRRDLPDGVVSPSWNRLDQAIAKGAITGKLTCEVAMLLRQYDPVNVSQYRVAMILDIIASESRPMNVSALMKLDVKIPGWQVLSMRYIEEALLLGYIVLEGGCAALSPKGHDEIQKIKSNGYSREYWMFVERRLHETLVASCPDCHAANVTHWFWPTFTCFKCNREVSLASCTDIVCRSANVALDQYKLA